MQPIVSSARRLALPTLALAAALIALAMLGFAPGGGVAEANHFKGGDCKSKDARQGAKIARLQTATACLINRYRRNQSKRRLNGNSQLKKVAKRNSSCMVRNKTGLVHTCGGSLKNRVAKTSYPKRARLGETVNWGKGPRSTPLANVNTWIHSAPHRRILLGSFAHLGVGVAKGSPHRGFSGGATYTAVFGQPL